MTRYVLQFFHLNGTPKKAEIDGYMVPLYATVTGAEYKFSSAQSYFLLQDAIKTCSLHSLHIHPENPNPYYIMPVPYEVAEAENQAITVEVLYKVTLPDEGDLHFASEKAVIERALEHKGKSIISKVTLTYNNGTLVEECVTTILIIENLMEHKTHD